MNCMVCDKVGLKGGWLSMGAPIAYGLNLAGHVHDVVVHVHWSSHCGTMLLCGLESWWPAFMSVEHLVCLFDWSGCII